MNKVRCAIYTRKSSEEGLEQDFNSLDAQYEACAAYVLRQASEGWSLLPERYDDGGLSGGTLERPALQRLLADVASGQIDIIVVYKVDRLTRSLLDFSRLVEALDAGGTSFVSVTQSFNTTTSMGRLTLNMLLSFAQFEREVTAERIRDKIAASKAKGMWMGGTPPLGYRPNGRTLAIIEEHASLVRDIYARYLETGNVRVVAEQLEREGLRSPIRVRQSGQSYGGCLFTRGQLYAILRNPVYAGEIRHGDRTYPGLHPAIIARDMRNEVQRRLAEHVRGMRSATQPSQSLLAGKIIDGGGEPLIAVHSTKKGVRYRYYVSRALQHTAGASAGGMRIPARDIETLVAEQVAGLFDDPVALISRAWIDIGPARLCAVRDRCAIVAAGMRQRQRSGLPELLRQVRVLPDRIEIELTTAAIGEQLGIAVPDTAPAMLTLTSDARLTRTGNVLRLVQQDGRAAAAAQADPTLIRLLVKARRWWSVLIQGKVTIAMLAREKGVAPSYMTRIVRLAFLAPTVVDAILDGDTRVQTGGRTLTATGAVAPLWKDQMSAYLPGE